MIELVPAEYDDLGFLSLARRIINGAIVELRMREVFLVHVDNWFDHKWLGWWSRKEEELRVPTFTPNRVRSEKHFVWKAETSARESVGLEKPLHVSAARPPVAGPADRPLFRSCSFYLVQREHRDQQGGQPDALFVRRRRLFVVCIVQEGPKMDCG